MTVTRIKSTNPPVKKNAFVYKLFDMLCNPKLEHLIWWTDTPDSNTFALYPSKEFADALSGYFKHGNVALFVRQLHMYGFHKVLDLLAVTHLVKDVWEFRHLSGKFRKNDELLLVYIKRRLLLNLRNPVLDSDPARPASTPPLFGAHFAMYPQHAPRPGHLQPHPHPHPHHALQPQQQLLQQLQQQQQHPHHAPLPTHFSHHAPILAPLPVPHTYSPALPQTYSPVPAHAAHAYLPVSTPPGVYMAASGITSTPPGMYVPPAIAPIAAPASGPVSALPCVTPRYMLPPPSGPRQLLWLPLAGAVPASVPVPSLDSLLHFRGPWDAPAANRPRNPSLRFDPLVPDDRANTGSALPEAASPGACKTAKANRSPELTPSTIRTLPGAVAEATAQAASRALVASRALDASSVRTLASSVRTLASSVRTLATSVRTLLYGSISHLLDPDASPIGPRDAVTPPRKRARTTLLFLLHDELPPKPCDNA